MKGELTLYVDQFRNHFWARTIAELRRQVGGGRVSKMYRDLSSGGATHVGYVVGYHWCEAYRPVRNPA